MLIFNTVRVKTFLKIIFPLVFLTSVLSVTPIYAADPSLSFYPAGGTVTNKDNGFTVDVIVNSGGQALTSARFVVTFDPKVLQLTKAEKNNTLFAQWPDDESTIDNTNGVVMLTGFSQTGTDTLYTTSNSTGDVMARLTFKILKTGDTILDWEFSGANEDFKSVLLTSGSPPQNILKTKPKAVTFSIGKTIVQTAIPWNKYVLIGGMVFILFGGLIVFSKPSAFRKKHGTIVVYDGN